MADLLLENEEYQVFEINKVPASTIPLDLAKASTELDTEVNSFVSSISPLHTHRAYRGRTNPYNCVIIVHKNNGSRG